MSCTDDVALIAHTEQTHSLLNCNIAGFIALMGATSVVFSVPQDNLSLACSRHAVSWEQWEKRRDEKYWGGEGWVSRIPPNQTPGNLVDNQCYLVHDMLSESCQSLAIVTLQLTKLPFFRCLFSCRYIDDVKWGNGEKGLTRAGHWCSSRSCPTSTYTDP